MRSGRLPCLPQRARRFWLRCKRPDRQSLMEKRSYQTPLGEIWLFGQPGTFDDAGRPVLLVLMGALATDEHPYFRLQLVMPEVTVVCGRRPGDHCPVLAEASVEAFADAYAFALREAFPGCPRSLRSLRRPRKRLPPRPRLPAAPCRRRA